LNFSPDRKCPRKTPFALTNRKKTVENETTKRTFRHVSSEVGAYEAEEVGVEHLLRDINDPTVSSLASRVKHKVCFFLHFLLE